MKGMLRKWVLAQLHSDDEKASPEEIAFLNECDCGEIVDSIPLSELPQELLGCRFDAQDYDEVPWNADIDESGKGAIIAFIDGRYGDMTSKIADYFAIFQPGDWSLDFLEMVSESDIRCDVWERCRWRNNRASSIALFKILASRIESTDDRSDEFWRLLFHIFTPAFRMFEEWDNQGLNFFMDGPCPEYMRGVVKMAKQGITPDLFETYMK